MMTTITIIAQLQLLSSRCSFKAVMPSFPGLHSQFINCSTKQCKYLSSSGRHWMAEREETLEMRLRM